VLLSPSTPSLRQLSEEIFQLREMEEVNRERVHLEKGRDDEEDEDEFDGLKAFLLAVARLQVHNLAKSCINLTKGLPVAEGLGRHI
jgi:hypothetical protein